jgi:hypothetical protein
MDNVTIFWLAVIAVSAWFAMTGTVRHLERERRRETHPEEIYCKKCGIALTTTDTVIMPLHIMLTPREVICACPACASLATCPPRF